MPILWPEVNDSPPLPVNELHVWAVELDDAAPKWDECWQLLSQDERQRADQFRLQEPRRRFVITRTALRTLLGQHLELPSRDVTMTIDSTGKPRLMENTRGVDLRFNVTHSGDVALIALCLGCEVGVDVERVRHVRHAEHIARRYFHPAELKAITAAPPPARDLAFLRVWTAKEAVLKAIGSGITGSLSDFCVLSEADGGTWVRSPPARCWLQQLRPRDGYIGAVASVGVERPIRCFVFKW